MVEAATGRRYEAVLKHDVYQPFGLTRTSLPRGARIGGPSIHGYTVAPGEPTEDVTSLFAAGWTWASGGVVSTPADANRFVRRYVKQSARSEQFRFVPGGSSEPPGPGTNSAGLALFRYQTRCGTVYGHTGNTAGYTQFIAANRDGSRSATVSVNAQITPTRRRTTLSPPAADLRALGLRRARPLVAAQRTRFRCAAGGGGSRPSGRRDRRR